MPGLSTTAYAAARNILIGGSARYYASLNYDPRVIGGIVNQTNLVTFDKKPLNGISKCRTTGLGAHKVADTTRYNRSGFTRTTANWVTTSMDFYESTASGSTDGAIWDPSIIEDVYYTQDLYAGTGNFAKGMEVLMDYVVAGCKAVFEFSLNNFFPHIYADIQKKANYDNASEAGVTWTFAQDTINASATQVVDISTLPTTQDDLADKGATLYYELRKLVAPVAKNDPHETPRICIPESVWEKYSILLEAYKGKYGTNRRKDDVNASGVLNYMQRYVLPMDGFVLVKFPDSAIPKDTTANPNVWRAMVLTPNAIVHGVNSVPIVGSVDVNVDFGGYDKSSLIEKNESLDQFYDSLGRSNVSDLRNVLNRKGADMDVIQNVMSKSIGENQIYNYIRTTIERLPMGTADYAKHYYYNSVIGEGTLRANPYCMREWKIPVTLVLLAEEAEAAGFMQPRTSTKTSTPAA
jgi:hypothetical protein